MGVSRRGPAGPRVPPERDSRRGARSGWESIRSPCFAGPFGSASTARSGPSDLLHEQRPAACGRRGAALLASLSGVSEGASAERPSRRRKHDHRSAGIDEEILRPGIRTATVSPRSRAPRRRAGRSAARAPPARAIVREPQTNDSCPKPPSTCADGCPERTVRLVRPAVRPNRLLNLSGSWSFGAVRAPSVFGG